MWSGLSPRFRISLTRRGYPRIIPRHHRLIILRHDDRANLLVKLYLSLFSFYSIIEIGKRISKEKGDYNPCA